MCLFFQYEQTNKKSIKETEKKTICLPFRYDQGIPTLESQIRNKSTIMMSKQRSSKWFWPFWYVSVPQKMRFLFWIFCFRLSNDWITFPKKSFQLRHTMWWLDKRKKTLSCPTDIWIGTIYSKKFRIQQMFVLLLFLWFLFGAALVFLFIYIYLSNSV